MHTREQGPFLVLLRKSFTNKPDVQKFDREKCLFLCDKVGRGLLDISKVHVIPCVKGCWDTTDKFSKDPSVLEQLLSSLLFIFGALL